MRLEKALAQNPDQLAWRTLSLTGRCQIGRFDAPPGIFPMDYIAARTAGSFGNPRVVNDPKLRAPLWKKSLPSELVIHRGSDQPSSRVYFASNEMPSRLIGRDLSQLEWAMRPQLPVKVGTTGGFIGFGSNAVLDWAGESTCLVHADISEEVLKCIHFIIRPLILISKSGSEFYRFLTGVEFVSPALMESILNHRYHASCSQAIQESGQSVEPDSFKNWAAIRDELLPLRDEVILRMINLGFDELTVDTVYRYVSVVYGLESPWELAFPLSTTSLFHTYNPPCPLSISSSLLVHWYKRYNTDELGLSIARDERLFAATKARYEKGLVRYAIGDFRDPRLYEASKSFFEKNGVTCQGVFTSNIQMFGARQRQLNKSIQQAAPDSTIVHWGFRDSRSEDLWVSIINGGREVAIGRRLFGQD